MSITSLPKEIQQYIMLKLGATDIMQCRMVSRSMASLINTTAIQYKLSLCVAAMIDGPPPSRLSLSERLEKLRSYVFLWSRIPVTFLPTVSSSTPFQARGLRTWPSKNGILPYIIGDDLRLLRPSSSVRDVEERTWALDLSQLHYHFDMCAVDIAQDLLVLSERPLTNNAFKLHLLALSGGNTPHSCAKQAVLHGPIAQFRSPSCRYLGIAGDILVWKVCSREFELEVWDWKAGIMLWKYSAQFIEVALLDSSHLLLLFPTEHEFRIISMDQCRQEAREDIQPTADRFLCALKLPPMRRGAQLVLAKSSIELNIPAASPDARPPFAPDPSASVVVFQFGALETKTFPHTETFLLIIPLSTVFSQCRSSTLSPQAVVPWADWGPHGTRILNLEPIGCPIWISALGSKCGLVFPAQPPEGVVDTPDVYTDVFLLDFHPTAALWPSPGDQGKCSSRRFVGARDIGREVAFLSQDVFTTLPFRMTYRDVVAKDPYWPINFCMTEDGFYFVVASELDDKPEGFLGFSV
ncbi:hypothetical protein LXA43DRAFT_980115 [Ganoderma leucocontextum]|nr:hypothetical protein LXA43DRAFT_980115 [Ganoderma leucocontextum]